MQDYIAIKLNKISLKDKSIFNKYLSLKEHELSVYAFENIYTWKALFNIEWALIDKSLCIFFQDNFGWFLYLPPLGANNNPLAINKIFNMLDKLNKNKDVSRIENIEETEVAFYENLGYLCKGKSYDYLCKRSSLANLSGNKFKSKRASFNYFVKHYEFECLPFSLKQKGDCMQLYDCWMRQRKSQFQNNIYVGMLGDARRCLKFAFDNYSGLDFAGMTVKVNKEIKGFSFGFKLNKKTFCILYEITDLSIKGIAQFIFAAFCKELKGYKYINIMDDSGLENLKKVKLSYHPVKLIPAYIVSQKNEQ